MSALRNRKEKQRLLAEGIDFSAVVFLLIDDNKFIRKLLSEILRGFGARRIHEAETVAEAKSKLLAYRPDLVICDWMMAPVDGMAFVKEVRGMGDRTPIIMVTGHATPEKVTEALGDGADSYIVKPFRSATLMDHLVKVIENAHRAEYVEL